MRPGGVYIWWNCFRKDDVGGQVATLITLAIAIIFLFVAVTLNISRVAEKKTVTANAVDGAAMKLASHLASSANQLSLEYLGGGLGYCKKSWGGLFKLVTMAALAFCGPIGWIAAGITAISYLNTVFNIPHRVANRLQDQLNKLGRKTRLSEEAIMYVLGKNVDDPTEVIDVYDYDDDGATGDKISRFAYWYSERVEALIELASARNAKIAGFMDRLEEFALEANEFRKTFTEDSSRTEGPSRLLDDCPDCTEEKEVITAETDGEFVALLQDLLDEGIEVSFWKPGADQDNAQEFDDVDELSADLDAFFARAKACYMLPLNDLASTYDSWMPEFYAEDSEDLVWHNEFEQQIQAIDIWRPELYGVHSQLDEMIAQETDPVREDYLSELQSRVSSAIEQLDDFQNSIKAFNNDIVVFYYNNGIEDSYAQERQATYSWYDSLGWHHVRVDVSSFALPSIGVSAHSKWYGSKTCVYLTNYTGTITVTVNRYDQTTAASFFARRENTPLWKFRYVKDAQAENAEGFDTEDPEQALACGITSEAKVWYTYNQLPKLLDVK